MQRSSRRSRAPELIANRRAEFLVRVRATPQPASAAAASSRPASASASTPPAPPAAPCTSMAERVGQPGKIRMGIPPQQLRDCANNVMVWLGPGDFPTTLPSCFRSPRTGRCGTTQSRPGSPGTPASRR